MLTVLMATHNGAETLPRVLESYTQLQPPPGGWKLVLIDNASDDGSGVIANSFTDRLPLTVLHESAQGKNHALNRGLAELEGDLAVFSDDDTLPAADWLVRLRAAADLHTDFDIFGGRILGHWEAEPDTWVRDVVPPAPCFGLTDPALADGPCEPTKVWGTNMAVRSRWFHAGYRFDGRFGPNRSPTYAMGGETELNLRLTIAERVKSRHCSDVMVHHIIRPRQLTRAWILRRAFHLGRCVRRESEQHARAGRPHFRRGLADIGRGIVQSMKELAAARRAGNGDKAFRARWDLNVWLGCLYQAIGATYRPRALRTDGHRG